MSNTFRTATEILRESLRVLHQKSEFIRSINRELDSRFANSGASVSGKIGPTLQVRNPVQFTTRTGNVAVIQDLIETKRDITVSTLKGVDFELGDVDLTLSIDKISDRYLQPAMQRLAADVESDSLTMYRNVWSQAGTPGTNPVWDSWLHAGELLDDNLAGRDEKRTALFNPRGNRALVGELKGLFHSGDDIEAQYKKGMIGTTGGFGFRMSSLVRRHTVGPLGGTPLVNGASQTITSGHSYTTSLVTDGWTAAAASRLKAGDVFTIASVFSVHPETKTSTGNLQQFVVTADVSSDGSGNLTAVVSPAIITGGAYQTVNTAPADDAAITVSGTANTAYPINLAYHKDAFTIVTADLELPKGMDMAARESHDGISMRFLRGFDIVNNKRICRFDVLYGFLCQRPELASRVIG